jgi:tetratricopeptide (TPR) repeat protein
MRAVGSKLALFPILLLAGCGTIRDGASLSPADRDRAEALARYSQGLILEDFTHDADGALRQFALAAALDPTELPLLLRVAIGHVVRKDYDAALRVLRTAEREHPRSAQVCLLLGMTYQAQKRPESAARAYRRVIRLEPTEPDGYVRLASLRLGRDDVRGALAVADEGLRAVAEPFELVRFLESLGRLFLLNNQYADATGCFERLYERDPENATLQDLLARCYALTGRRGPALQVLLRAAAQRPDDASVHYALGELYEEEGRLADAIAAFTQASRTPPRRPAPYLRLAHLYLRTEPAKSTAILEEALQQFPEDPLLYTYLGLMDSHAGRYAEAVRAFEKAERFAAAPPRAELVPLFYYWFGAACERSGDSARGEQLLGRCLELHPETHEALNYLAYLWAEKGVNLDRALEYIARALQLEPDEGAYVDTLGWIHFKNGRYAEALQELRRAHALLPDDPTVADHLGDALRELRQNGEAVTFWKRSFRMDPRNDGVADKLRRMGVDVEALRREAARGGPAGESER